MKHKIIVLIVLLFVPLQTIGLLIQSPFISSLGFSSLLSPFPYVFSRFKNLELITLAYEIDISFRDGSNKKIIMNNSGFNKIDYFSYYTKSSILRNLTFAPLLSSLGEKSYSEITYNLICRNSLIKKSYFPNKEVIRATIYTYRPTKKSVFKKNVNCE